MFNGGDEERDDLRDILSVRLYVFEDLGSDEE